MPDQLEEHLEDGAVGRHPHVRHHFERLNGLVQLDAPGAGAQLSAQLPEVSVPQELPSRQIRAEKQLLGGERLARGVRTFRFSAR